MSVRTRFAPSPTGSIHLGNIRTALYCWLYSRSHNGEFVLRIEDTDQERSTKEATNMIIETMNWLGLKYDLGPFYQTERLNRYRVAAEKLIDLGLAYRCYCSKERLTELREQQFANKEKPRYDGHCRDKENSQDYQDFPFVIRFKNPKQGSIEFVDQILGPLSFQNSELDDLILVRTDGFPTYNFCVVVDDLEMKITHVIRGADHINNTPRQINIFQAFEATPPIYAHMPLILGQDGKLLSKRHGASSVLQYRDDGFLPEAMINYLVRLGWSHGDQEIFSREEMIQLFDIKDINKAAAAFDPEKLLWMNRHYIKNLDPTLVADYLIPQMNALQINYNDGPTLVDIVLAFRERVDTLREMAEKSRFLYEEFIDYNEDAKKHLTAEVIPCMNELQNRIKNLAVWDNNEIHTIIEETAKSFELKLGKIAQPLRAAVTGTLASPPIDITLRLLGKNRVLVRIARALHYIENQQI
jgi:glutamyl-tRNA synthetase